MSQLPRRPDLERLRGLGARVAVCRPSSFSGELLIASVVFLIALVAERRLSRRRRTSLSLSALGQ